MLGAVSARRRRRLVAFDAGILHFNAKSAITIRRPQEYLE
jgi:hypothetical protein